MTTAELLSITDGAKFLEAICDGGFPPELNKEFAIQIQTLWEFEFAVTSNGFHSLYDQTVPPHQWPDYERLLDQIGAMKYSNLLRKARDLYFGKHELPKNIKEWQAFKSIIWSDPKGEVSRRFDDVAKEAEKLFYSEEVFKKLGAYIRNNWNSLCKETK